MGASVRRTRSRGFGWGTWLIATSRRFLPTLGFALCLAGCAPQFNRPTFENRRGLSYDQLRSGRVAVLPIASLSDQIPLYDLFRLDGHLLQAFDKRVTGVERIPYAATVSALQDEKHYATVMSLATTRKASAEQVRALGEHLKVRYLVFTTVNYAAIRHPIPTAQMGYGPTAAELSTAGDVFDFVELSARIVIVDTLEQGVSWEGEHTSTQWVAKIGDPHAYKLAWLVFSTILGGLPSSEG
jgi:hypothetical protein